MRTTEVQISLRIRYYDVFTFCVRNFKPVASCCACAGLFESYLVENPEDRFSRDEAQIPWMILNELAYCPTKGL